LERSIGALSKAISETNPRVDADSPIGSPELVTSIREVVVEIRKTSGESRRLADALQQVQSSYGDNSAKKSDGFFRRLFGDR